MSDTSVYSSSEDIQRAQQLSKDLQSNIQEKRNLSTDFLLLLIEMFQPEEGSQTGSAIDQKKFSENNIANAEKFARILKQEGVKTTEDLFTAWDSTDLIAKVNSNTLYQGLLKEFGKRTSLSNSQIDTYLNNDWKILKGSDGKPLDFSDPLSPNNPFVKILDAFLSTYKPIKSSENSVEVFKDFMNQFHDFIGQDQTVALQKNTLAKEGFPDSHTYEGVYQKITKDFSKSGFENQLNEFYQDQLQTKGYFIPNQSASDWKSMIQSKQSNADFLEIRAPKPEEALAVGGVKDFEVPNIYDFLYLLMDFVTALENLAVAQANSVTKYTDKAMLYTELISQIPYLDTSMIGEEGDEDDWTNWVNSFNQNVSGVLSQELQSLRSQEEEKASAAQSALNTTTAAINDWVSTIKAFIDIIAAVRSSLFS